MTILPRSLALAAALAISGATLTGCAGDDLSRPPPPIGDFFLGHVIVVADKAEQVGPSRDAAPEDWQRVLTEEVRKRTGRYDGEKYYHLGIKVEAYALAYPGIPVVVSPKSVLVVLVNVWDDAAQRRINAEPKEITVFENFSPETVIGSGLTKTGDDQMRSLAANAAQQINDWLVENQAWFTPEAAAARATLPAMTPEVQPTTPLPPLPAAN